MQSWRKDLATFPPPLRGAVAGALGLGSLGAIVGLVVGLLANPPTAWFAVFEVGVPAAFVGAWIGLMVGALAWLVRRPGRRS